MYGAVCYAEVGYAQQYNKILQFILAGILVGVGSDIHVGISTDLNNRPLVGL